MQDLNLPEEEANKIKFENGNNSIYIFRGCFKVTNNNITFFYLDRKK